MTLYRNLENGSFGLKPDDVRAKIGPDVSFVDGADLTDFGFEPYEPTTPPNPTLGNIVVEVAPVGGVQQWAQQPDGRTLADRRADRLEALAARRRISESTVVFSGVTFPWDEKTENRVSKAIQALERQPDGTTVQWEVTRGVFQTLNLPFLHGLGDAAFAKVQAAFGNVKAKTTAIMASSTPEAVDIETGWP